MAFSRLIVQLMRNRALNPVWLRAARIVASRASIDPDYAYRIGCVLMGLGPPPTKTLGLSVVGKTARQAVTSPRASASRRHRGPREHPAPDRHRSVIGGTTSRALTPRELADWTAGVGRALTELTIQSRRAGRSVPSRPADV